MGGSSSKKTKLHRSSDKKVQVLLDMAREEAAKGNDAESQKYYENAIKRAPSVKEQNIIRKEMSSAEGSLTKVVPSPSLKRQSTAKTKSFNAEFNKMKKFLDTKDFGNANEAILCMLQMDCQELKDVDEYFNGLFDYVQNIRNFQGISQVYEDGTLTLTAAYACRQNILMLIKDLAFASFQRRQGSGLCLDASVHASMIEVLDKHETWLKASNDGMTMLYFHIDYIRDILTLIPTTKGNVNTVDVLANVCDDGTEHWANRTQRMKS